MSPEPIIALQQRLTIVGAIRAGGEKQPRAPGRKLEAWRITSARRQLVEQAAALYGGTVAPWEGPNGSEWQVYTEADELPVLVMPTHEGFSRFGALAVRESCASQHTNPRTNTHQ